MTTIVNTNIQSAGQVLPMRSCFGRAGQAIEMAKGHATEAGGNVEALF